MKTASDDVNEGAVHDTRKKYGAVNGVVICRLVDATQTAVSEGRAVPMANCEEKFETLKLNPESKSVYR
jgi:hypothetical protein